MVGIRRERRRTDRARRDRPPRGMRAAGDGAERTARMRPRLGRASYLGERSADHLDPGATSTALLFEALAGVLSGGGRPATTRT